MSNSEIAIITGSDFDLTVMKDAARALDSFGVNYVMKMLDVHRNPDVAIEFAKRAHVDGLRVLIAGGSGAAHLPGMLAAYTTLPVIGVPIKAIHSIDGLDAIYSMLQMPIGLPVATMALNGAKNAAILALQILAIKHPSYNELVQAYKTKQRQDAAAAADKMNEMGHVQYLTSLK